MLCGPILNDTIHLNNVYVDENNVYISCAKFPFMFCIADDEINYYTKLPVWCHNARPFNNGVIMNDTYHNKIMFKSYAGHKTFCDIVIYPEEELLHNSNKKIARQGYARGLVVEGDLVAGGSAPATVTIYEKMQRKRVITMTMDVRDSVHGLSAVPSCLHI
jgi:hypothetical protein